MSMTPDKMGGNLWGSRIDSVMGMTLRSTSDRIRDRCTWHSQSDTLECEYSGTDEKREGFRVE